MELLKVWIKKAFVLLISLSCFITSCADKEQVQEYQTLRIATTKLISLSDLVIEDQKAKQDSLDKIGNDYVAHRITTMDIEGIHDATMNTIDIQSSMSKLKIYFESITFHCTIIEKASTRFGYLLKGKRKIKRIHSQIIYDINSKIIEITEGLTPKDFIYKYLPEKDK